MIRQHGFQSVQRAPWHNGLWVFVSEDDDRLRILLEVVREDLARLGTVVSNEVRNVVGE